MFAKFMSMLSWMSPELKWVEHLNRKQIVYPAAQDDLFANCVLPKDVAK